MTDASSPADIREGEQQVALPARTDAGLYFIGAIRTPWMERSACPRRGNLDGPECRLEIQAPWHAALDGIGQHDTLDVLYWMHLARRDLVHQNPKHRGDVFGTFALRSPVRPNPIAVSTVRLVRVEAGALVVRGLDCVDGTPLLDVKPSRCPV